ncbi:MAG TPA: ATP-dependent Clp protease adaptor ClpS [Tepidiformaceae bacterium]|nr:ATP-dependent Clp protease adaptor ClpS [Tepidiformaceae bacterium]
MATLPNPGTQVIEREETEDELAKPYHLILLDDDQHTYQYVIQMLNAIFGYPRDKGFAIACMVDKQGQAIVMTGPRDEVSLKQQLIHAYGADPYMEHSMGSMSAIMEPVA